MRIIINGVKRNEKLKKITKYFTSISGVVSSWAICLFQILKKQKKKKDVLTDVWQSLCHNFIWGAGPIEPKMLIKSN
jgi:hypothetical protein